MTPSQMLAKLPQQPVTTDDLVVIDCIGGTKYTSEAMEEDFSVSVELLLATPMYLEFLRDADNHYKLLGEKARQALDEHLATIEEFTGQWLND